MQARTGIIATGKRSGFPERRHWSWRLEQVFHPGMVTMGYGAMTIVIVEQSMVVYSVSITGEKETGMKEELEKLYRMVGRSLSKWDVLSDEERATVEEALLEYMELMLSKHLPTETVVRVGGERYYPSEIISREPLVFTVAGRRYTVHGEYMIEEPNMEVENGS